MAIEFISKQECSDAMDMICKAKKVIDQYEKQRLRSDYFIPINYVIDTIDCSQRLKTKIKKSFSSAEISIIGDLMSHTKSDLCKLRNIGSKSLDIIFTLMDDISNDKFLKT